MRAADVALTPTCEECGDVWLPADDRRWQAHRIDIEFDYEPAIAFSCDECAEREFGDARRV
jgi:hypothetical protein